MFGDTIQVFERDKGAWDPSRRTPKGIGYSKYLYSSYENGKRGDSFEWFLAKEVDGNCAPVLRKIAAFKGQENMTKNEAAHLAHFIAFAAARAPFLMDFVEAQHLAKQPTDDSLVRAWCAHVGLVYDENAEKKLLKKSLFKAIDKIAHAWRERVMTGQFWFIRAPREAPFITSDWPVLGDKLGEHWGITFPVSSEIALVAGTFPGLRVDNPGYDDVRKLNLRTMSRAKRFIVCHQKSFPGDEMLEKWAAVS